MPIANSNYPPPDLGESSRPLGHPSADAPRSTDYAFIAKQPGSKEPVAYDPCRPIHYVVNPTNEPVGAAADVRAAIAAASEATGLEVIDDGTTTEQFSTNRKADQPGRYDGRWAPVLIDFTAPGRHPDQKKPLEVGLGGSAAAQSINTGLKVFVSAAIFIDSTWATQQLRAKHSADVRAVLEHELGHVLGLAHVHDPTQLMNPQESSGVTSYRDGDLAGLARLGAGRCAPDL